MPRCECRRRPSHKTVHFVHAHGTDTLVAGARVPPLPRSRKLRRDRVPRRARAAALLDDGAGRVIRRRAEGDHQDLRHVRRGADVARAVDLVWAEGEWVEGGNKGLEVRERDGPKRDNNALRWRANTKIR